MNDLTTPGRPVAPSAGTRPTWLRRLRDSPAVILTLLLLTAGLAVGLVVEGADGRAATASTGTTVTAPAADPALSADVPGVDPTSTPTPGSSAIAGVVDGGVAVSAAPEIARGQMNAKAPQEHAPRDPRSVRPTLSPSRNLANQPARPLTPIGIGNMLAVAVLAVAGAMLLWAGRLMVRLIAVLGAVVQVVSRIGSALTVVIGALILAIVAVLVAR